MRRVLVSPAVEAELDPAALAQALTPQRLERARCGVCNRWADVDEPMAISVIVGRGLKRTFATHPKCAPSQVLRDDSDDPSGMMPKDGLDVLAVPLIRRPAPHGVVAIEMTGSLTTSAGPTDLVDISISTLLEEGFGLLMSTLDQDIPRPSGWRAIIGAGQLEVTSPAGVPLYLGPVVEMSPWLDAIERSGELVVVAGSLLGTRDPDPVASLEVAIGAGRAVAGIVPANRRVEAAPRNALCPCGSGRKYKHCHGRTDRGGRTPPTL